jgi:tripartite-type tricarboxylate transporter receptor subunit TctC
MMEKTIRSSVLVALAITAAVPATVLAQAYPSKQIRMIVPFPPGGGVDFAARVVGKQLAERLGQQVVIDNRPGANGIVGLEILKQSPADGYTIACASQGPLSINPSIYAKLPYDSLKDFAPLSNVVNFPLLLVVHPSLPVKSVTELIALARKNPDQLSYSHPGAGNSGHLAGELFNSMAKVKILAVPDKGTAPAAIALLSGEVQLTFSSIPTVLPHVRAGRLRALGVGNAQRVSSLPEFPTIAENGLPGYEAYAWGGMLAPAGTPKDIVARLNKEIVASIRTKEVSDQLLKEGTVPTPSTPEEFGAYIKAEIDKWGAVVRMANIKGE